MSATGSGIEGLRADSLLARLVGKSLSAENFKLIDIGCSGGLPAGFRAFGDRLEALAFDGLSDEVARLTAEETNSKVRYVTGLIGMPADHPLRLRIGSKGYWHNWTGHRQAYERHADLRAARAEGRPPGSIEDYYRDKVLAQGPSIPPWDGFDLDYTGAFKVYDPPAPQTGADENGVVHLSAFLKGAQFEDADFLKIDIDGPDWEVLRSATDLLARPSLLGAALEVNFVGSHDANDNTFHNTDRLMREKGFTLVALSVRTYSSAALPFPYLDVHPSMNQGGRPTQGDAVYVRDLASPTYAHQAAGLSDEKIAKAAALLSLFSLPDYAAEMLVVHRERLSRLFDVDEALDLLAAEIQQDEPETLSYRDYIARFEAEDPRFFDLYSRRNSWMQNLIRSAGETQALTEELRISREQTAAAERQATALRRAFEDAQEQAQAAKAEVAALRSSTSWKLTAPLRRLLGRG